MPNDQDQLSNMGLTEDARQFVVTIQIPTLANVPVLYPALRAPFPFKVMRFHYTLASGTCTFTPRRDSTIIQTDKSATNGSITIDQPSTTVANVIGSVTDIAQNQSLNITMGQVTTDDKGIVIEIVCRRTEVNVAV